MAVSTISSALWATGWINKQSQDVINLLNGNRSAEQMIWEYFWLRKEVQYSDDWQEVVWMINEFRDFVALQQKKVQFVQYFKDKGMTEEMYYKVIPREFTYIPEVKEEIITNPIKDEQPNDISSPEPKGEQPLLFQKLKKKLLLTL